jgi:hypothetical protein
VDIGPLRQVRDETNDQIEPYQHEDSHQVAETHPDILARLVLDEVTLEIGRRVEHVDAVGHKAVLELLAAPEGLSDRGLEVLQALVRVGTLIKIEVQAQEHGGGKRGQGSEES